MPVAAERPRKTACDLAALPHGVRAELLLGEIYVTPSPSLAHQRVTLTIAAALREASRRHGGGEAFVAPLDVHLPMGDVVQPDVLWIAARRAAILASDGVHGVPDLVVEVISAAHPERDRAVKRAIYERCAVPEVWFVDPSERSVEVLRHDGSRLAPAGYLVGDGAIATPLLPGWALALDEIFEVPRP